MPETPKTDDEAVKATERASQVIPSDSTPLPLLQPQRLNRSEGERR